MFQYKEKIDIYNTVYCVRFDPISFEFVNKYYRIDWSKKPKTTRFRYDPVNKGYHLGSRHYRHPRTTQERKLSLAVNINDNNEHYIKVRAKRNYLNLVDSFEDYPVSNIFIRSWKRTNKSKQWMKGNYKKVRRIETSYRQYFKQGLNNGYKENYL